MNKRRALAIMREGDAKGEERTQDRLGSRQACVSSACLVDKVVSRTLLNLFASSSRTDLPTRGCERLLGMSLATIERSFSGSPLLDRNKDDQG
jgi:hypothetical protein